MAINEEIQFPNVDVKRYKSNMSPIVSVCDHFVHSSFQFDS